MLDDLKKFLEGLEAFLDLLFGGHAPDFLLPLIGWVLAICIILNGIVFSLGLIKKIWGEFIQPAFYNHEERRSRLRRQRFSDYIESEIRRLNLQESWNDHRFTELEAEVEAEGKSLWFGIFSIPFIFSNSGLRREESLSIAIEKSPERLILLEGDPGSGKSVALRHVAQKMAIKARQSRNLEQHIPFYVNLKGLRREEGQTIGQNLIES